MFNYEKEYLADWNYQASWREAFTMQCETFDAT